MPHAVLNSLLDYLNFQDLRNLKKSCPTLYTYFQTKKVIEKKTLILHKPYNTNWYAMFCDETLSHSNFNCAYFTYFDKKKPKPKPYFNFFTKCLHNVNFSRCKHKIQYVLFFIEEELILWLDELSTFFTKNKLQNLKEILFLNRNNIYLSSHFDTFVNDGLVDEQIARKQIPWNDNKITSITIKEIKSLIEQQPSSPPHYYNPSLFPQHAFSPVLINNELRPFSLQVSDSGYSSEDTTSEDSDSGYSSENY